MKRLRSLHSGRVLLAHLLTAVEQSRPTSRRARLLPGVPVTIPSGKQTGIQEVYHRYQTDGALLMKLQFGIIYFTPLPAIFLQQYLLG